VAQLPGATVVWLKVAGSQALVRWQLSHEAVVRICPLGLPRAVEPLWQVAHLPTVSGPWMNVAGVHAVVR